MSDPSTRHEDSVWQDPAKQHDPTAQLPSPAPGEADATVEADPVPGAARGRHADGPDAPTLRADATIPQAQADATVPQPQADATVPAAQSDATAAAPGTTVTPPVTASDPTFAAASGSGQAGELSAYGQQGPAGQPAYGQQPASVPPAHLYPGYQQPRDPYADPTAAGYGYGSPQTDWYGGQGGYPTQQGYPGYPGYATQPGYGPQPPYGAPMGYPAYGATPPNNSLAVASLVLSLVGLGCGITAPVGAVLGHIARRQIRVTGESGDSMALAGIIIGWILTGFAVLWIAFLVVGFAAAVDSRPPVP